MMEIDSLPEHLDHRRRELCWTRICPGIYRRFGAQVTVVEMQERLIAREDEDVSKAVREILEGEGV